MLRREDIVFLHADQGLAAAFKADTVGGQRSVEGGGHGLFTVVDEDLRAVPVQDNASYRHYR